VNQQAFHTRHPLGAAGAPTALPDSSTTLWRRILRLLIVRVVLITSAVIVISIHPAQAASLTGAFAYQDCVLSCTASAPETGTAGAAVSMNASANGIYCNGLPEFRWNFGDGSPASSSQSPSHAYANPGVYNWTMMVTLGSATCTQGGRITISARVSVLSSVSAASYSGARLAAESIVAAFGTSLATATEVATTLPLPTTLAGTRVLVKDSANVERQAPLFFVAPTQVNYLVPQGTADGPATVTLVSGDNTTSGGSLQISSVAPGLFSANASGQGVAAAVALRIKTNGTQSVEPVARFDQAQNRFVSVPIDPGPADDQVFLILFGTGIRNRSALTAVTASIGGVSSEALFAGPQGEFVGLDQLNLRLPRSLAGRGEVDITLTVDGQTANLVRINIR